MPHSRLISFGILLLLIGICAAAEPARTEDWFVIEANQSPYGSQHILRRTLENGNLEYRVEMRVLVDLLGQREDYSSTTTYVVTPDFLPVSIHSHTKRSSGEVLLNGTAEAGHLILTRESNGLTRSSQIDLQNRPLFQFLLPEALARQPETSDDAEVTFNILEEEYLSIETAKCRKIHSDDPSISLWSIELGGDALLSRGTLTLKSGHREREEFSIPRYSLRRGSAREAETITHRKLEGRDGLMFEVDKPIVRIDQLQSLTVKLRWKDIPLESLHLTDPRQSLMSHHSQGTQHEALVRIAPSAPTAKTPATLIRTDREKLLGKSRFIDPSDAAIIAKSEEWTKDCRTPEEIVTALSENIFRLLNGGTLISETLSGPEVLQCRKGKCSEFAILFASLARAKGIPTRIVLGDRMVNANWIGHMWNEVFIAKVGTDPNADQQQGRWVVVDSTAKEVGYSSALLKFTHSDSVYGTQPVRWELTNSLEVSIADYSLNKPDSDDSWKTGIEGNVYTNADFGIQISVPNENWKFTPDLKASQLVMRLHDPDDKKVMIHCVAFSLPALLDAKTILTIRNARFNATYDDYKVLSDTPETIGDREWKTLQFTHTIKPKKSQPDSDDRTIKTTEYAFNHGKVGFLINLAAEESAHDKALENFQEILKSIVLKK